MLHSWKQACRIIGFLGRSPNINPTWCWEPREGWLTWLRYVFVTRRLAFMIITLSLSPFSVVFSDLLFSSCSSTVDVGFAKLSSDCFCGIRVFKMNIEFCCYLCCSSSMILDTILFNVQRSLALSLGFRSLFLLADEVFPCRHNHGYCCSGYT